MNVNKSTLSETEIVYNNMLWMWRTFNRTGHKFYMKEFNQAAHFSPIAANKAIETILANIYG